MSISWYSISINLNSNNSQIFNGRFSVNETTNAIVHFVNAGKINVNILDYPVDNYQADNKFVSGKFTFKGTVVSKINAVLEKKYNAISWNIWQSDDTSSSNLSYLSGKDKLWYDLVDNSGNYGSIVSFTIVKLPIALNSKIIPQPTPSKCYMKIYDKQTSSNVFLGYFIVDVISRIISIMVNTLVSNENLLTYTADDNYSDYKFVSNKFTMAGTAITSIPALDSTFGATEWQLWNYNGTNCLSYKNASNEWIAITPLNSNNRFDITISNKPFP